jgi:hypothetical protein
MFPHALFPAALFPDPVFPGSPVAAAGPPPPPPPAAGVSVVFTYPPCGSGLAGSPSGLPAVPTPAAGWWSGAAAVGAPRLYGCTLWGGPAGLPAPWPGPAPSDFWTALAAWFAADRTLPSWFPGGLGHGPFPASGAYPYASVDQADTHAELSAEDAEEEASFAVYADTDDGASRAAAALASRLDDPLTRPPFAFGRWVESGHRPVRPTRPEFAGVSNDGAHVWKVTFAFRFWLVAAPAGRDPWDGPWPSAGLE